VRLGQKKGVFSPSATEEKKLPFSIEQAKEEKEGKREIFLTSHRRAAIRKRSRAPYLFVYRGGKKKKRSRAVYSRTFRERRGGRKGTGPL